MLDLRLRENMTLGKKILQSGLTWIWLAVVVIALDRFSKIWMMNHLNYQEPMKILPFFNFTLAYNRGAAFSFLHNASGWQNLVLGGLALIVSLTVIFWLAKVSRQDRWLSIALCLILGGALGNAWDRILYHYVVDFLDFHLGDWHFAIFNLADSAISIGAFMLFWHWTMEKK